MPAVTQVDKVLRLTLDGVDYACQVIDGALEFPNQGTADTVAVACGDKVAEPGDPQPGSITGTVFKDTSAAGITRALAAALTASSELSYVWTENAGTAQEWIVTGKCRVNGLTVDFTPDKYGRHPLDLSVSTAVVSAAHTTS